MHGGAPGSGAPIGNKNAFRHGCYTAEEMGHHREKFMTERHPVTRRAITGRQQKPLKK
jgi:hypothetical protein